MRARIGILKLQRSEGMTEQVDVKKLAKGAGFRWRYDDITKIGYYYGKIYIGKLPDFLHSTDACIEYLVEPNLDILWVKFIRLADGGIVCHIKLRDGSTAMGKASGGKGKDKYATALCIALEKLADAEKIRR